jgi:pimeloyl-ACP methyl ester carboxylesterase
VRPSPADETPLLGLHGGPGSTHHCLESLEALAARRRVILHRRMPRSQLAIIEDASHLCFCRAASGIHHPG